jgi:hypothetical protein
MTDYERCVNVMHSEIKDKYVIPDDLERQWFLNAIQEYSLDVCQLIFDEITMDFNRLNPPIYEIGLIMVKYYCKQELSRINKLNNIVGKDLQLTGMGQAKSAIMHEYLEIIYEIEQKLHKHKKHAYN